ncbi:hypothetical protein DDB_G0280665 [Dictyostelium discoideum AX4]|uniref:Uncharacterized protein n=1 Tax=Dictyostelium discoideum TaxID=44689 RepID=Q54V20_DICDI|nr:hypothetical protein DDB_G0280665 [Dictyostelium discoideum AX4]EAL67134.1 hypothetical protein DDB_G0280665 [Dictyostelium discoideum AX4]|eukprot:XP_641111.1 hypothetical protein DDB_G0280665 [Dictyostelium discoideum AX4]
MTSIFGDLILQDGAKIIRRDGSSLIPSRTIRNATINIGTMTNTSTPGSLITIQAEATFIIDDDKYVEMLIGMKFIPTSTHNGRVMVISGLPLDLVSTKPPNGSCMVTGDDNYAIITMAHFDRWVTGVPQAQLASTIPLSGLPTTTHLL